MALLRQERARFQARELYVTAPCAKCETTRRVFYDDAPHCKRDLQNLRTARSGITSRTARSTCLLGANLRSANFKISNAAREILKLHISPRTRQNVPGFNQSVKF